MNQLQPKIQDYTYTVHCDKYNKSADITSGISWKQEAKTDVALSPSIIGHRCSIAPYGYCLDCKHSITKL